LVLGYGVGPRLGCPWAAVLAGRPGKPGKPPFLFLSLLFSVLNLLFEFCLVLQVLNYLNIITI
jgi:hypothetical protein